MNGRMEKIRKRTLHNQLAWPGSALTLDNIQNPDLFDLNSVPNFNLTSWRKVNSWLAGNVQLFDLIILPARNNKQNQKPTRSSLTSTIQLSGNWISTSLMVNSGSPGTCLDTSGTVRDTTLMELFLLWSSHNAFIEAVEQNGACLSYLQILSHMHNAMDKLAETLAKNTSKD